MSIKSRIALRLIGWLAIVGVMLFALAGISLNWTMNQLSRIEAERDFESAGLYELVRTLQQHTDGLEFDPDLLEMVQESGGWLQRIDEQGRVTDAFLVPEDVPDAYGPGELTAYWLGQHPFPYQLYLWVQKKNGQLHTLIYGRQNRSAELLRELIRQASFSGGNIVMPDKLRSRLIGDSAWLQLLDHNGSELASFNKPPGAVTDYSVQELTLRSVYPNRYGTSLLSYYDAASGRTWVLSSPLPGAKPGVEPTVSPENRALIIGIGSLLLAAMLLFVLVSYWFGHRFGSPIAHVLQWLANLGNGKYEEPTGAGGVPRSRNRRGGRKRKYRVYRDVIDSMGVLSRTLHRNEKLRLETERMRDEWIAGVSHDLRTPLSSLKGYAHLLENPDYDWTAEEVRSFAGIMLEKSSYMDGLINDLTLTYQLKNGQGAPSLVLADLNVFAAEAVGEAANHPLFPEGGIRFLPSECPVYIPIYKPWFQRIVDNLTANALLHNNPDTILTVSVRDDGSFALLIFADNGSGMDEETASWLFDRYFRGVDTESRTEGTGLGMAVTKALVEALGGSIEVRTSEGEGTTIITKWKKEEHHRAPHQI